MAEQTAQYDHIGSKYDEYAQTATLRRVERYTFFRLVGALTGKKVLDLACGNPVKFPERIAARINNCNASKPWAEVLSGSASRPVSPLPPWELGEAPAPASALAM